jgi:hypothetical protein
MTSSISTSSIVREAFRLMELDPGSSLADGTAKAIAASEQYPEALRECLEQAEWSFASTIANLAEAVLPDGAIADPELPYLFTLPGDCVRLLSVGDDWTAWRLDAVGLRADDPAPLQIRYTTLISSEAALPATFRFLVALTLAIRLAPMFQTNSTKLEQLRDMAAKHRVLALRQDARTASQQRTDDLSAAGDWVSEATL